MADKLIDPLGELTQDAEELAGDGAKALTEAEGVTSELTQDAEELETRGQDQLATTKEPTVEKFQALTQDLQSMKDNYRAMQRNLGGMTSKLTQQAEIAQRIDDLEVLITESLEELTEARGLELIPGLDEVPRKTRLDALEKHKQKVEARQKKAKESARTLTAEQVMMNVWNGVFQRLHKVGIAIQPQEAETIATQLRPYLATGDFDGLRDEVSTLVAEKRVGDMIARAGNEKKAGQRAKEKELGLDLVETQGASATTGNLAQTRQAYGLGLASRAEYEKACQRAGVRP